MQLILSTQAQQLILSTPFKTAYIDIGDKQQKTLQSICNYYQDSHNISDYQHSQDALLTIGEQLYQTINTNQPLLQEWLNDGVGSRQLEILADATPRQASCNPYCSICLGRLWR